VGEEQIVASDSARFEAQESVEEAGALERVHNGGIACGRLGMPGAGVVLLATGIGK
jgi:hypothetical protein